MTSNWKKQENLDQMSKRKRNEGDPRKDAEGQRSQSSLIYNNKQKYKMKNSRIKRKKKKRKLSFWHDSWNERRI